MMPRRRDVSSRVKTDRFPNTHPTTLMRTASCSAVAAARPGLQSVLSFLMLVVVALGLAGCASPKPTPLTDAETKPYGSVKLREGDIVIIKFPGSAAFDTTQPVRRDGKITLQLVGEVKALGLTPLELEKAVLTAYGTQLATKEVSVTLASSSFPVYVAGAVVRPGKIMSDRPITALEAVMEAGGFDPARANMKAVVVIRNDNGTVRHYILNLQEVLQGRSKTMFYMQPSDILNVPESSL